MGIIRVHELRKKFYNIDPGYDSRDGLGDTYSTIEVNLAIIAACGPTLRPLFRKLMPGFFSNKSSNPNYNGPSGYGHGTGNRRTEGSYPLKEMGKTHTEIRGHSPDGSEEEIMSFHGIIRTTAVGYTLSLLINYILTEVTRSTSNMMRLRYRITTRE